MSTTKLVRKSLFTKPYLLTAEELAQYGQDINLVGFDPQLNLTSDDSNVVLKYGVPSSPKILNWVEPYEIGGINYTLFFTEVNSGLNVGDKVFIINGTYDSNLLIQQDKYKKGHDGYKVLWIDRCKVVLDIVFTGNLPTNDYETSQDDFDKLVKVYYLRDQNDFIQANRQVSTRGGTFSYKFGYNQNSIVYTDTNFLPIVDNWGLSNAITDAPGFYIKNGQNWQNITSDFISGSFSVAVADNADKILILNNSFQFNNNDFKENLVYYWNSITGTYDVWVKHENKNVPILTRSNFRDGTFNGTWNGGVYGSNEKRIGWTSSTAIWNHGTLLNTIWEKGIMNSLYSQPESFIADYTFVGTYSTSPYQKSTNPDNDGYGYNFIINSEIRNAVIRNANVSNSAIGATGSSASFYNIVEEHVNNRITEQFLQDNFNNTLVNKALFDSCEFRNSNIQNAIVRNSRSHNSRFYNVKSINTQFKKSVFKNSNYISDNTIKILDYKEFNYSEVLQGTETHKVYKFYINKRSYEKFQFKDYFYIKGLVINDGSDNLINFFDKRLKIGPWREYIDIYNNGSYIKQGIDFDCFISTPIENQYDYAVDTTIAGGYQLIENLDSNYSIDIFVKYVPTAQIDPNSIRFVDIIDFSNAYISNSDFESGVFENSTWNSGNHINFNNDVIINNNSTVGGDYDIQIDGTQSLVVKTRSQGYELEQDYIKEGEIIFINGLDYDSRGKVTSLSISASGSNYITDNNVTTSGGSGTGLIVDIIAQPIGAVYNFIVATAGSGSISGLYTYNTITISGSGSGLLISLNSGSNPTIVNPGSNYQVDDIVEIDRVGAVGFATNDVIKITSVSVGDIISVTVSNTGLGYQIDDLVTLSGGSGDAILRVTGITGSLTRLGDTYKIRSVVNTNEITLDEVSSNIISTLLPGGLFSTYDAKNRWGYLSKAKFYKSKIVSGIFRRAYFNTSLIKNDRYDLSDRDFGNIEKIKTLLVTDTLFSNVNNYISNATYMNSFFVGGTDIWENGILYNSIWNGGIFNNGLVKQSTWIDGNFNDGLFYDNRTFDANSTLEHPKYNDNNISNYYIQGNSLFNNRYSWQNGIFFNGEFYKSDWEGGIFNGGKFYYSKFYNGIINGGVLGDLSIPEATTLIYNGLVNYTTVENAVLSSEPFGFTASNTTITWNNGIFNNGVFSANNASSNTATWRNGIFNNGSFTNAAKWLNGIFNGGKFISKFGYDNLFSNSINLYTTIDSVSNYSWENGTFNGGEFGNAESTTPNSTWYKGIFNAGTFKGKVWNNGAFISGEFIGSYTYSVVGDLTSSNANLHVGSFSNGIFFGLWKSGYVTDTVDRYLNQELYTDLSRSSDITTINNDAVLRNILWIGGTFSHPAGLLQNSVWLNGTFEKGRFFRSSFNPYVRKLGFIGRAYNINSTNNLFNYNDDECYWLNGTFEDSEFFISNWYNGQFISGTASGMIWKNGIVNYMNAYNIFWEDGLWKNGNWYGSNFLTSQTGSIDDDFTRQVLFRGMSWSGTASTHVWNIFLNENLSNVDQTSSSGDDLVFSWAPNLSSNDLIPTEPIYGTAYGDNQNNFATIAWYLTDDTLIGLDDQKYSNETGFIQKQLWIKAPVYNSTDIVPSSWDFEYTTNGGVTWTILGSTFDPTSITNYEEVDIINDSLPYEIKYRLKATRTSNGQSVYSNIITFKVLASYEFISIGDNVVTPTNFDTQSGSTFNKQGILKAYRNTAFTIVLRASSSGSGFIQGRLVIGGNTYNTPQTYTFSSINVAIPAGLEGRQYNYTLSCIISNTAQQGSVQIL